MTDPIFAHRVQFAMTVMFHYLFPILTMGLGFFIALYSTMYLRTATVATATRLASGPRFSRSTLPSAW